MTEERHAVKTILLTNRYSGTPLEIVESECPRGFALEFLERQDADAARVDLPGLARLILVVRPGFALHAADDQYAHAFLVQVFPVRRIPMPDFNGCPEATAILKVAAFGGDGVVEINVQPQQAPWLLFGIFS